MNQLNDAIRKAEELQSLFYSTFISAFCLTREHKKKLKEAH